MTKSSGFTLIELLVVVAILGIISAIGIVSYSGYVSSTKKKSTENIMRQVALGQTEYYADNGLYYPASGGGSACTPTADTSEKVETNLLGGAKVIGPLLIGLGRAIEIVPLRSSTSEILNLASVAAYSAGVINYGKVNWKKC